MGEVGGVDVCVKDEVDEGSTEALMSLTEQDSPNIQVSIFDVLAFIIFEYLYLEYKVLQWNASLD